jgi:hypothetical protein
MRDKALATSVSTAVLPVGERARELSLPAPVDSLEAEAIKAAAQAEGRDIRRA